MPIPRPLVDPARNAVRVQHDGASHRFGDPADPAAWAAAHAFCAAIAADRADQPAYAHTRTPRGGPRISWALLWRLYCADSERRHRKRGSPTKTYLRNRRHAEMFLADPRRATRCVNDFGPLDLSDYRDQLAAMNRADGRSRFTRRSVNDMVRNIIACVRFGESQERVRPGHAALLATLRPLRGGDGDHTLREPVRVVPPSPHAFEAALAHCPPAVAAMARLHALVGMRAIEACHMRVESIEVITPRRVALYRVPAEANKTDHLGRERVVMLGPRARRIYEPWLRLARMNGEPYVFSPRISTALLNKRRSRRRVCAVARTYSLERRRRRTIEQRGVNPHPVQEHYTTDSYRRAITRACKRAGLPKDQWWSPRSLRHLGCSTIAAGAGVHVAQQILGHADISTTQIYLHPIENGLVKAAADLL